MPAWCTTILDRRGGAPAPRRQRTRSLVLHININGVPATITSWTQAGSGDCQPALPLLLSATAEASRDRTARHLQIPPAGYPPRDELMADFLGNII